MGKSLPVNAGDIRGSGSITGQEDPLEAWQRTPVFLCGESHGQRSLMDYSSWNGKEVDTAEVT